MKKIILRVISSFFSIFSPAQIKSTYWSLSKIKVFGKSIDDCVIFFIPKKIKLGKYDLFLNQKDVMVSGSIALGLYERFEIDVFLKALTPEMTVVDIGANIGYYTLLAAQHVKQVFAFEPDRANYHLLVKNITQNNISNVASYQLAVGDNEGEVELFANPNNYGDRRIYSFEEGDSKSSVSSVMLDNFLQKLDSTHVDFIKMDIQGAEGRALAGMGKILEQENLQLIMEFFPHGLRATGFNPVSVLELLSHKKFNIYHLNTHKKTVDQIHDYNAFTNELKNLDYVNLYCKK